MPNPSIKDEDTYEALRDKGYSKEKSARIANAQASRDQHPSRKGGKAAPYEEWTKDALYRRAQELDVDGRSDLTKDELIAALRG
ncbi:DUF7218 family protein [Lutimaribacter saemankumensis]|uniref:Rho termination factor, N-terminal domain n=1 Tax=Lutimaribacter saemankumensis TaxID=490829 RepID=A0A1G8I255_9RHOB|nr:Rho termination factor [Lutimaribacter saemankumensis]SDI12934.1 hypothetical protein SAMN05421850_101738 [Lutimaribacter saemankumensis]